MTIHYTAAKGIYTDITKTKKSQRSSKFPPIIMELLKAYKKEQDAERERLGDRWQDTDRIFVKWDGRPMNTGSSMRTISAKLIGIMKMRYEIINTNKTQRVKKDVTSSI